MVYKEIYKEFKMLVPEGEEFYKIKERENLIDDSDGMHVVFGMVVVPYIIETISSNKREIIEKVFRLMEQMAVDDDIKIRELLDFTILEGLIDEGHDMIKSCKKFMGVETLQHCKEIKKYFN